MTSLFIIIFIIRTMEKEMEEEMNKMHDRIMQNMIQFVAARDVCELYHLYVLFMINKLLSNTLCSRIHDLQQLQ